MKYLLKTLVILIACATLASWLKMGIPGLSIGYWKLWLEDSIRHKIGIIIGVPLFELLYGWHLYLFALGVYLFVAKILLSQQIKRRFAAISGLVTGAGIYALSTIQHVVIGVQIYAVHSSGYATKHWYSFIDFLQLGELMLIYGIVGLFGGLLYFRWLVIPCVKE